MIFMKKKLLILGAAAAVVYVVLLASTVSATDVELSVVLLLGALGAVNLIVTVLAVLFGVSRVLGAVRVNRRNAARHYEAIAAQVQALGEDAGEARRAAEVAGRHSVQANRRSKDAMDLLTKSGKSMKGTSAAMHRLEQQFSQTTRGFEELNSRLARVLIERDAEDVASTAEQGR